MSESSLTHTNTEGVGEWDDSCRWTVTQWSSMKSMNQTCSFSFFRSLSLPLHWKAWLAHPRSEVQSVRRGTELSAAPRLDAHAVTLISCCWCPSVTWETKARSAPQSWVASTNGKNIKPWTNVGFLVFQEGQKLYALQSRHRVRVIDFYIFCVSFRRQR